MQYNVQLINYKHGQQIRKYSRPVIRGNKKVHDIKCIAYRFHYGEFKFINIYKKYQCRHNEPYVVSRRSHYMYLPLSLDEQNALRAPNGEQNVEWWDKLLSNSAKKELRKELGKKSGKKTTSPPKRKM